MVVVVISNRPTPLVLSIAVLDNMSAAAESKEKEAQDKRLLHVLEVRYVVCNGTVYYPPIGLIANTFHHLLRIIDTSMTR
jgi:hypothetical protein